MVRIRDAGPDDAGALSRVRSVSWKSAYDGLLPAGLIGAATTEDDAERRRQVLAGRPELHALIAEDGAAAVGMAMYGPDRRPGQEGVAELYALYVLPDHWSRKVGRALLERVLEGTRAEGYPKLSLWVLAGNGRARRFYERFGFTVAEHKLTERYGHTTSDVRYERELADR